MPHTVWDWLIAGVVMGCPWLVALRRRELAAMVAVCNVAAACTLALVDPSGDSLGPLITLLGLCVINLGAFAAPAAFERGLRALLRRRTAAAIATLVLALVLPLGSLELACRFLTETHVLHCHRPIETVWRAGADDWRLATITGDENREPDPVLLWRPVPRAPFTAQRFKGPTAQLPKPPGVMRVMCYGDSLTDGPRKGGWPTWLGRLCRERCLIPGCRFEVLNAGVAGYSSHQGLLRFLQEVDEYEPDLLVVSFGWNDAADAIAKPDKSFQLPPWPVVACQRALIRYRTYLVLMNYTGRWLRPQESVGSGPICPRVSIDDYLTNLDRFRAEARSRGIPIAFLTRPHRLPADELRQKPGWRNSVPEYNAALRAWARRHHVPLIDAQDYFEQLSPALFVDECHFIPQGYQILAELVGDRMVTGADGSLRWVDASRRQSTSVDGALVGPPRDSVVVKTRG
jgi:lysophospholipase L1-like esterase